MTDSFEIVATICNCSERGICFHIGALALSSGYEEPTITFKCDSDDDKNESDKCATQPCSTQPLQEVYVKCEQLDQLDSHPAKVRSFIHPRDHFCRNIVDTSQVTSIKDVRA